MNSNLRPARRPGLRHSVGALLSGLVALGLLAPALPLAAAEDPPPTTEASEATESTETADTAETPEAAETTEDASTEDSESAPEAEAESESEAEAEAEEVPLEAAPGEYRNWFNVSVGGLLVEGDKAAVQQRTGLPATAVGGVEEFHFEKDISRTALFKIDGRGIFDNEDYSLRLDYTDSDKGFLRGGIRQYRQFYDGSGGWFPGNDQWFSLYDDRLELLRGTAFFEAGLRLPNIPEITLRYSHDYREGDKDSTSWGDTGLTGGVGPRSIVPSFWHIDETTDTVEFDVRHTLGNTTFGAGFLYEHGDIDNSRNMRRRPGEAPDRHLTQSERVERDTYGARAFVETTLNDKVRMTSAYQFTTLDTDIGGNRIAGSDYDPIYDPVYGRGDIGFLGLNGGSQLDQHVWNLNLFWNPLPHVAIIPSFRLENQDLDGASSWLDTGAEQIARTAGHSRDLLDLSQQLEVRYTGITNVVLYARGDWVQGDGNLFETQTATTFGTTELYRDSDFDRFSQKYTGGIHWYPLQRLNLHAQYYRKMRDNRYGRTDPAAAINLYGFYPEYLRGLDFVTDDVNFRVTWRPLDKLTLVTRYDFQLNTIDNEIAGGGGTQASESTAHIIGQTVTWTPTSRLYIQPGVNFVFDRTESDADDLATVEPARNDYVNLQCAIGLVLDDRTDLQAQYSYYLADNFRDVSEFTQPYGADAEEHAIMTTLIRRITPRLRMTLRYGYLTSDNDLSGGYNDYNAHIVSTSAQYLF